MVLCLLKGFGGHSIFLRWFMVNSGIDKWFVLNYNIITLQK